MINVPVHIVDAPTVTVRPARNSLDTHTLFTAECDLCGNWQVVQLDRRPDVVGTSHYCPTALDGAPALVLWT